MIVLTITMDEAGSISVNGPLPNKVLCFGLLEMAKLIVQSYEVPLVVVPNIVLEPPANN